MSATSQLCPQQIVSPATQNINQNNLMNRTHAFEYGPLDGPPSRGLPGPQFNPIGFSIYQTFTYLCMCIGLIFFDVLLSIIDII